MLKFCVVQTAGVMLSVVDVAGTTRAVMLLCVAMRAILMLFRVVGMKAALIPFGVSLHGTTAELMLFRAVQMKVVLMLVYLSHTTAELISLFLH